MSKISNTRLPIAALILISVLFGLWPGDAPWFFDLPRFLSLGIEFNATPSHVMGVSLPFTPAPYGLKGTHGVRYGPLAVWLDQVFLFFTHDPITMTAVRSVFFAAMTGLTLLWLTRILKVNPWLAVITMCSPWMLYYSRELWDNSLSMPFCALSFVAYGRFLHRPQAWSLCLAWIGAALMSLVHVTSAPFVFAMLVHMLVFEMRWVVKFFWPLLTTFAVILLISMPWLHYFLTFHGTSIPVYASPWHGWVFPFFGAAHHRMEPWIFPGIQLA